ncbi:MAG: hypothetical protein JW724_06450 [Candidatus Altiarchaeota archaeon]|nr:hypothetical protein [Candidatus Altiarchaeota archaeon]
MSSIVLLLAAAFALEASAGYRVYFYEAKTAGNYKLNADYSQLKQELVKSGHKVDLLVSELSKENLNKLQPDVLVIPNLGGDFTTEELRTLFEFVMEDGKGLFICGTTTDANKITVPLGMMMPEEMLEDGKNRIRDASTGELMPDMTNFYVDLPVARDDKVVSSVTRGVNKLDFFGAHGIYLFGDKTKSLVSGGDSTYTPKSLFFLEGTNPTILAYSRMGRGTVIVLTDPDMFSNKYLDSSKYRHDNIRLAVNIIDWLGMPSQEDVTDDEWNNIMKAMQKENMDLNRTIQGLNEEKDSLNGQISELSIEKQSLQDRVSELTKNNVPGMPFDYMTLGLYLLAGCFIITAIVVVRKNKKDKAEKEGEEKSELGYEFDEKAEGEKGNGRIKEEDVEERLKELQKNSQ